MFEALTDEHESTGFDLTTPAKLTLSELGKLAKDEITLGDISQHEADIHYRKAGEHLAEAKRLLPSNVTWPIWLSHHCPALHKSRANELIAFAENRKTLTEVRRARPLVWSRYAQNRNQKKLDTTWWPMKPRLPD
jgi:hypothetical protein